MTSGQNTHRPFNGLICKHHDVIGVERRMDSFKANTELRELFKVSTITYLWANLISTHYKPVLPLATFPTPQYPRAYLPAVIPETSLVYHILFWHQTSPWKKNTTLRTITGVCMFWTPVKHIMFVILELCKTMDMTFLRSRQHVLSTHVNTLWNSAYWGFVCLAVIFLWHTWSHRQLLFTWDEGVC